MEKRKRNFSCDDKINIKIASELAEIRKERSLTQEEVAKSMGIAQCTLAQMESATRNISLTKLIRYAEALGVELTLKIPPRKGEIYLIRHCRKIVVGFKDESDEAVVAPGIDLAPSDGDGGQVAEGAQVGADPEAGHSDEDGPKDQSGLACQETSRHSELPLSP